MNKKVFAITAAVMVVTLCVLLLIQLVPFFADNSSVSVGGSSGSSANTGTSSGSDTGTGDGSDDSSETVPSATGDLIYHAEEDGWFCIDYQGYTNELDITNRFTPYASDQTVTFIVNGVETAGHVVVDEQSMICFPDLPSNVKLSDPVRIGTYKQYSGTYMVFFYSIPGEDNVYYLVDDDAPFTISLDGNKSYMDHGFVPCLEDLYGEALNVYISFDSSKASDRILPGAFYLYCFACI